MNRQAWFGLVVGLALILNVSIAGAADTSPYLIGAWEDDGEAIYTDFSIVNPTTILLDVYAAFFNHDGGFLPGKCFKKTLRSGAKWDLRGEDLGLSGSDTTGTVKFIAFPSGKRTVDPGAGIGGHQTRWVFEMTSSQTELRGVTVNLYTTNEFSTMLGRQCGVLEPLID